MLSGNVAKVRAINARYAQPRLIMSPVVRWSLLALRIYLLTLVGLLGYKFFTLVVH
ncbi:MAG: hypothetical protein ACLPTZ_02615 [Beijerinckiaceae bacterium]